MVTIKQSPQPRSLTSIHESTRVEVSHMKSETDCALNKGDESVSRSVAHSIYFDEKEEIFFVRSSN